MEQQPMQKKEVGAVWKKTSKKGTEYLSIALKPELIKNPARLMAFPNKYKQPGDKKPDYTIFEIEQQDNGPM
jgi:hypothetical protein